MSNSMSKKWLLVLEGLGLALLSFCYPSLNVAAQQPNPAGKSPLPTPAARTVDYKRDVEPILSQNCYTCHGASMQMNGLRLDDRASLLNGGHSGAAITPGNSAESRLIQMVSGVIQGKVMPPTGARLTAEQIGLLRAWIDQGARWAEELPAVPAKAAEQKQGKVHWAFLAPKRPNPPKVKDRKWVHNPIDNFVLNRLELEKIKPSPEADKIALVRRLSLDLTGLPPTLQEVADFVNDPRPNAYEGLVDRLLESPHYGEKWARHWLDLARYADSDGYEKDNVRPYAWKYRDWVIHALNQNMPFDQFTIEQIAGDLLPNS